MTGQQFVMQRLGTVMVFAAHVFGWAMMASAETDTDRQILFWQSRLDRDPEDPITPTKLGVALLQKGRESGEHSFYGRAEEMLQEALKRNPGYTPALSHLASASIAQHKFRHARTLADKVVRASPEDAYGHGLLGDAALELGDITVAEKSYTTMLDLAPSLAAYSRQANLLYFKGENRQALASYSQAIDAGTQSGIAAEHVAWCHAQKGHLHFRTGDFEKAEIEYELAGKLFSDHALIAEYVGELRAAQGRYDEALAIYRKLHARMARPELSQALGDLLQFMGRIDEAKKCHDSALAGYLKAAEQGDAHYYHHLAAFYADTREQPEEAVKWARKDLEIRQSVFAWDTLAWALYRNGKWMEALQAAENALKLGTEDAHLLFHAGTIHQRAGIPEEGRALLEQALKVNPRYQAFHIHR